MSRAAAYLLLAVSAYVIAVLGTAIGTTVLIEQDAAYYVTVAERLADGEGLTSLCDRRGLNQDRPWPIAFEASTLWPVLLAGLVWITGEGQVTGSLVSMLALVGALWLGTLAVRGASGASPLVAAVCVVAALLHRRACEPAILPMSDCLSLCVTAAFAWAVVRRRVVWACGLLAFALVVRYQNVVLLLPLLALLPPGVWRGRVLAAAVAFLFVAVLWWTKGQALEGIGVFVNPGHRDSLARAVRFLFVPMLFGLWFARGRPAIAVFWLLGLGHLFVLLANHVPSEGRPWMFGNRQGLPLHFVAAAFAALALHRVRGRWWGVVLLCVLVALGENGARPFKTMRKVPDVTGRLDMILALDYLEEHPLAEDAIVLCHDCDVLAHQLRIRGVHLRAHRPDPAGVERGPFVQGVLSRPVTHVVLTWQQNRHMARRNETMDGFERCLAPVSTVVADLRRPDGRARTLILGVRR